MLADDIEDSVDVTTSRRRPEPFPPLHRLEAPDGIYRPGRGWAKIKPPGYWRRESEIELMPRRCERVEAPQSLNPA